MNTLQYNVIKVQLEAAIKFLESYKTLANCHMVDFIANDIYTNYLPKTFQDDIARVGIKNAANLMFEGNYFNMPNIAQYVTDINSLKLKNCPTLCLTITNLHQKLLDMGCREIDGIKLEIFMNSKKSHEVEKMSAITSAIFNVANCTHVIDIGDGKGYLSSMLALHHKIPVLGIDAKSLNTEGAAKRAQKLSRVWNGIKNNPQKSYPAKNDNLSSLNYSLYRQITKFVDCDVNIEEMVENEFNQKPNGITLVGLHTCGNLSPSSIRIFDSSRDIKAFCNVGCCYHLIDEEFEEESNLAPFGFPLSQFLRNQKYVIGRNARMVASQSTERIWNKCELPNKSIFYRALLQILLKKHCDEMLTKHVGKLRKEYATFPEYVRIVLQKLGLDLVFTDEYLDDVYRAHLPELDKLNIFYLLRSLLSPVIETVILLDRLLFLYEKGYCESYITQIFEPVISPRCYAIISFKQ